MKATGLHCRHDDLGQGFSARSRLEVWAAIFRMLSPPEIEAVCVVNETVENGVGDGWVSDDLVPMIHGNLACDDGGATLMPVVDDLEEIAALVGGERSQSPVVEDEELDPR